MTIEAAHPRPMHRNLAAVEADLALRRTPAVAHPASIVGIPVNFPPSLIDDFTERATIGISGLVLKSVRFAKARWCFCRAKQAYASLGSLRHIGRCFVDQTLSEHRAAEGQQMRGAITA